jgi:hypothetical protein
MSFWSLSTKITDIAPVLVHDHLDNLSISLLIWDPDESYLTIFVHVSPDVISLQPDWIAASAAAAATTTTTTTTTTTIIIIIIKFVFIYVQTGKLAQRPITE